MPLSPLQTEETLPLSTDGRWDAVQRIIQWEAFQKSPRLSRLLLFLAEQSLLEPSQPITEHNVAAAVFERTTDFDPGIDTIVRSQMVRLRQKVDQYAAQHPAVDYHITVPRGEYRVRFEPVETRRLQMAQPLPLAVASDMSGDGAARTIPEPAARLPYPLTFILGLAVLLLGAALILVVFSPGVRHAISGGARGLQPRPHHLLWERLFQPERRTILVSADSGLVMLHHLTGKRINLSEYLNHDFAEQTRGLSQQRTNELLDLADRRYTSFVDLDLFRRVDHLPYTAAGHLEVKYARDVHINDLKKGNVILSGSQEADPWLDLYEPGMNFVGEIDPHQGDYRLRNRKPLPGELAEYDTVPGDPGKRVFGILAFLSNLDGDGNALIVEGSNMAGTEAISDFLFDDSVLLPFLAEIQKKDGTLPHFEVVVESTSINGSAGPIHIVAYRIHR